MGSRTTETITRIIFSDEVYQPTSCFETKYAKITTNSAVYILVAACDKKIGALNFISPKMSSFVTRTGLTQCRLCSTISTATIEHICMLQ